MQYPALLFSALIVAASKKSNHKRRQCQCGAVADPLIGLCRKCQSRNAWRRKTTKPRRKIARRRLAHRVHDFASHLADVLPTLPIPSSGMES